MMNILLFCIVYYEYIKYTAYAEQKYTLSL